ncbi:hypothetical protein E1B28_005019 [Marasmius oreades]|uniref:Thioester reductase (TE) domain-containing protein n=1 Tax=Marasmius oreades TaxID=181124 RepID=A0A9P8ADK2_9AGAR|nr:uncharacterized protein E1B28_005019 [Marasmius oreades]KAG7097694.1 hypothetical protein E1B28_005019 [Marasmius oreades]
MFKEMILIADPVKPFEFTPKGTPRRQATLEAYAEEIEAAYVSVKSSSQTHLLPPLKWDSETSLEFVQKVVGKVLKSNVPDDGDLFQYGCDSLQATWIRNTILHALRTSSSINTREIGHGFVYQHPSIKSLANFLVDVARGSYERNSEDNTAAMLKLVERTSGGLPRETFAKPSSGESEVVLATGTTGTFGCYILASLLCSSRVSKVYAIVRKTSNDIKSRQKEAFVARRLDVSLLDSPKLVLLEGDTTADNFGLNSEVYKELQDTITSIFDNAWMVDFNVSLSTLKPFVWGTRKLVDLALTSKVLPCFIFVSSAGVARNIPVGEESFLPDPKVAAGWGYAESKWCAEALLQKVGEETPLKPIVVRCGQLSGARGKPDHGHGGFWKIDEWFPTLVKCSTKIGLLPDVPGKVSWIPIDVAAQVVVELGFRRLDRSSTEFFNIAHSRPVPAMRIMKPLKDVLGLELVPYAQWFKTLEASIEADAASEADQHVVARLLEFFRSMQMGISERDSEAFGFPEIVTGKREKLLAGVFELEGELGEKDIEAWIREWRLQGLLS